MKSQSELEDELFKRAPRRVRDLAKDARRERRDAERAAWKAANEDRFRDEVRKGRGW